MKTCYKCNLQKEYECFHKRTGSPDGRQNICIQCRKLEDAKRMIHPELRAKTMAKTKEYYIQERQKLYDYMKDKSCSKCGEKDRVCLSFHHIDRKEKSFNIAYEVGRKSWEKIQAEIDKCVILCFNCHARETAKDLNWYKDLDK